MSQPLRKDLKQFVAWFYKLIHPVPAMGEPLTLSLGQQFELERMNRAIDETADRWAHRRGMLTGPTWPPAPRRSEPSAPPC
jgi:hypothetical protein